MKLAVDVIGLPRNFAERRDVTFYSLLRDTGYFKLHGELPVNVIFEALRIFPDYVRDWLQLSEDRRCDAGWYFRPCDDGGWEVGYFSLKESDVYPLKFTDSVEACATFIKHEIEGVRLSA